MATTTYFIVGASRGLGLGLVKQTLESDQNTKVIAGARNPSNNEALKSLSQKYSGRLSLVTIDVTSDESVAKAAETITATHPSGIDYLVLNAGIIGESTRTSKDLLDTFNTNTVSLLRVSNNFIPLLKKGQKKTVLTVSSQAGSIASQASIHNLLKAYFTEEYGYRVSKAAVNALNTILAEEYRGEGISFVVIHPGLVETDMFHSNGTKQNDPLVRAHLLSVETSIKGVLQVLHKLTIEDTGKFYDYTGQIVPF